MKNVRNVVWNSACCLVYVGLIGLTQFAAFVADAYATPATPTAHTAPAKPSAANGVSALSACPELLNKKFTSLQGKPQDFCNYRGKVVVVVNTASYCGFTEQYQGLQSVYDKYKEKGLVVVGFPANDFGKQEPGSNAEVADFCERT